MGPNKYVHLMFGVGAVLLAGLLALTTDWVWGYFAKPPELAVYGVAFLAAAGVLFYSYRSQKTFESAQDVVHELEKVTWPTRKETSAATVVVIVTVALASIILSAFDAVWSFVTNRILS